MARSVLDEYADASGKLDELKVKQAELLKVYNVMTWLMLWQYDEWHDGFYVPAKMTYCIMSAKRLIVFWMMTEMTWLVTNDFNNNPRRHAMNQLNYTDRNWVIWKLKKIPLRNRKKCWKHLPTELLTLNQIHRYVTVRELSNSTLFVINMVKTVVLSMASLTIQNKIVLLM